MYPAPSLSWQAKGIRKIRQRPARFVWNAPAFVFSGRNSQFVQLEAETARDFDLPIGAKPHRSADRAVDYAEVAGGRDRYGLAGLQRRAGRHAERYRRVGEVGPVEEVVKLRAELEADHLGDLEALLQGHIELVEF